MRISVKKDDPFYCDAAVVAVRCVYVDGMKYMHAVTLNSDEGYIVCIKRNPVTSKEFDHPEEVDYYERVEGVVTYELAPDWTHERLLLWGATGEDHSVKTV